MGRIELLERAEIAELLGVEGRTITNYCKATPPIPTRRRRGGRVFFPARECVAWYVQTKVAEALARAAPGQQSAKQREQDLKIRKLELEVGREAGELMPVALHERRLQDRCNELAARTRGLSRYVQMIRSAPSAPDAERIAEQMEDDLLKAFRDSAEDVAEEDEEGGDGGEDPDGDGSQAIAA